MSWLQIYLTFIFTVSESDINQFLFSYLSHSRILLARMFLDIYFAAFQYQEVASLAGVGIGMIRPYFIFTSF